MVAAARLDFEPLGEWVLVEPIARDKTKGGLALPDGVVSTEELMRARVLAVGPGRQVDHGQMLPMPLKVGDVIYMATAIHPITVQLKGKKFFAIQAGALVAKCSGDDE